MSDLIKVWLHGADGRMGKQLCECVSSTDGFQLVGGSDKSYIDQSPSKGVVTPENLAKTFGDNPVDVIIDFSIPSANLLLAEAIKISGVKNVSILVGTTGLDSKTDGLWQQLSKESSYLHAPNTSLGILLTLKASLMLSGVCSTLGYDIEIVETHHKNKIDSPSGTANYLASEISSATTGTKVNSARSGKREDGEIGVHSVRGGGVFGEHEVRVIGENEEITVSHRALSRRLFADGALVLSRWLVKQKPGSYRLPDIDLNDLI